MQINNPISHSEKWDFILMGPMVKGIAMRRPVRIVFFSIAFLLIVPALSLAGQYSVICVVDGDTIVINYEAKHEKVRLLCVNTPESVHPDNKQNVPMGKVASDYTKQRLRGNTLTWNLRDRSEGVMAVFLPM